MARSGDRPKNNKNKKLLTPIEKTDRDINGGKYKCKSCGRGFGDKLILAVHILNLH